MASNTFGKIFKIMTWGESHGKAIGVVIDGCPAGLLLDESDINKELAKRSPGQNPYTTPRKEADQAEILSGTFEGKTSGAPISIVIYNRDQDSSKYEPIKNLLRPGHANFTYLEKYGIFDYRGGGRSSARETACRVAAGAIAKKILKQEKIEIVAFIKRIGGIDVDKDFSHYEISHLREEILESPIFCPDQEIADAMMKKIQEAKESGDSLGGVIEFIALNLPVGLGDPVYEKLEANLAKAMLSIPATKGFEIGSGFAGVDLPGSEHNDSFTTEKGKVVTATNRAGGTLGGISTGMPLIGRVAFKATSSIMKEQQTVDLEGKKSSFKLPEGSRHDPCVAIRAVPIVEAMTALVLVDALLMNRCSRID